MAVKTTETTRPAYVSDSLKIPKYKPTQGEFVFRTSYGEQTISSTDPHAVQSGQATFKYGNAALHPAAAPALKFLEDGPFWVPFSFHPQNDYKKFPAWEAVDKMIIDQIEDQVRRLEHESFKNTLKSVWRDSFVYGFAVAEMNFDTAEDRVRLQSVKTHSPHLFDFYADPANNLSKIYYRSTGQFIQGSVLKEKFLITTYPYLEHGKYYGTSILQSVYFDIKMIEILERAQAEGVRAFCVNPIVHHYLAHDLSLDDLSSVQEKIFNLDSGSLISLPGTQDDKGQIQPSHSISVLEGRAEWEGVELIKNVLDVLYKRVNRRLGLPDDLGFTSTKIGSLAKAAEEFNLYTQTIVSNQDFIESFVNKQIVPAMIKYNYPSLVENHDYILPKFQFDTVEEDALSEFLDQTIKMIEAGILNPADDQDRKYIRIRLELPDTVVAKEDLPPQPIPAIKTEQPKKKLLQRWFRRGKNGNP